jgi:hypothetical protein
MRSRDLKVDSVSKTLLNGNFKPSKQIERDSSDKVPPTCRTCAGRERYFRFQCWPTDWCALRNWGCHAPPRAPSRSRAWRNRDPASLKSPWGETHLHASLHRNYHSVKTLEQNYLMRLHLSADLVAQWRRDYGQSGESVILKKWTSISSPNLPFAASPLTWLGSPFAFFWSFPTFQLNNLLRPRRLP